MPTPSPNPPPDPISPAYSFSTCPDDLQPMSRPEHEVEEQPHPMPEYGLDSRSIGTQDTATPTVDSPRGHAALGIEEATAMLDRETLEGVSSRSTTLSPSPLTRPRPDSLLTPSPGPESADTKPCDPDFTEMVSTSAPVYAQIQRDDMGDSLLDLDDCETSEGNDYLPAGQSGYPSKRAIPLSPSSFLRPGSRFHGTQQSERQQYDVQVEIKHVDLRDSTLCGYLRIQGLTPDNPTLTTFFDGEIIGSKYGFLTEHETWGANNRIDGTHWTKFGAFRPFAKAMRKGKGNIYIQDPGQRETIFMRWKERFLVPDHRVKTITGASYEGFYYICFNQLNGDISGIYFHSRSEKYQRLELKHIRDRGCFGAIEFR